MASYGIGMLLDPRRRCRMPGAMPSAPRRATEEQACSPAESAECSVIEFARFSCEHAALKAVGHIYDAIVEGKRQSNSTQERAEMPQPGVLICGAVVIMSQPILEEQLFNLSPKAKVVSGFVIGSAGAVTCVALWEHGWIAWGAVFAMLIGPVLYLTGRRELAREHAFDAEVDRARAEWSELEQGVRAARSDGKGVARYLQSKGYREFAVRRWIAQELDPGQGR